MNSKHIESMIGRTVKITKGKHKGMHGIITQSDSVGNIVIDVNGKKYGPLPEWYYEIQNKQNNKKTRRQQ